MSRKSDILERLDFAAYYREVFPDLPEPKADGRTRRNVRCPFHDDRNPSMSLNLQTGRFKCFGCKAEGSIFDFEMKRSGVDFKAAFNTLAARAGLEVNNGDASKVSKPAKADTPKFDRNRPDHVFDYRDEEGALRFQVCRYDFPDGGKTFRQRRPDPDKPGAWIWNAEGVEPVPYNLQTVVKEDAVLIAEGEKAANALIELGLPATCNAGGAENWPPELNQWFRDKDVYILPDADEAGDRHFRKVWENLKGVARKIYRVDLPDPPPKGDAFDFIARFKDPEEARDEIDKHILEAKEWTPPKPLTFDDIVLTAPDFCSLEVPERESYLQPWLKEASINMLSGWRGAGKSLCVKSILKGVALRQGFGPWPCKHSAPCLYLDGEMVVQDDQERLELLDLNRASENPIYIYADSYANAQGFKRANLIDPEWRGQMKAFLIGKGIKLFAADNISSLAPGLDENSKQEWDPINQWLLELRFAGISTILVHHLNKDGGQRGTSGREDNLDISIMLTKPPDYVPEDGARFIMKFTKARVRTRDLDAITDHEFHLTMNEGGKYEWAVRNVKQGNKAEILKMLDSGTKQADIADALGVTPSYVSKVRTKAIKDGWLTNKDKLTQSGFCAIRGPESGQL